MNQAVPEYPIKIVRPGVVGQVYHTTVVASMHESFVQVRAGQTLPAQSRSAAVELRGMVKILAINSQSGENTRLELTVDSLTNNGLEVCPRGTTIAVENDGDKTIYSCAGNRIDPATSELLLLVIEANRPDRATNPDDAVGTAQSQKVGGSWNINPEVVAEQTSNSQLQLTGDQIHGTASLQSLTKVGDVDALIVTSHCDFNRITQSKPDGSAITDGTMAVDLQFTLPTDPIRPIIAQSFKMHATLNLHLADNLGDAVLTMDRQREARFDWN